MWIEDQQRLATTPETAAIRLPLAGKKGLWNWLQPYVVEGEAEGETETRYNALQVGEEGKFCLRVVIDRSFETPRLARWALRGRFS
jgi:hypothetical protein